MSIEIRDKNGFLRTNYEEENNIPHGYWENYYPNGNISRKGYYDKGKPVGEWFTYWDNGNVMFIGSFNNLTPIGKWLWYHPDKDLMTKEFYI